MRIPSLFLFLATFTVLLSACASQQTPGPPAPAGETLGKPTLVYVFADP